MPARVVSKHGDVSSYNLMRIKNLALPKVKEIQNDFLHHNKTLEALIAPDLESVGVMLLFRTYSLSYVSAPKLKKAGDSIVFWSVASFGALEIYTNNKHLVRLALLARLKL